MLRSACAKTVDETNWVYIDDSMPNAPHSKWNCNTISKQTILNRISLPQMGIHMHEKSQTGCIRLHTSTGDSYFGTWLRHHCGKRWRPSPAGGTSALWLGPRLCMKAVHCVVRCALQDERTTLWMANTVSVLFATVGLDHWVMPCSKSNLFFLWHPLTTRPTYVHSRGDLCIRYVKEEYPYVFQVHPKKYVYCIHIYIYIYIRVYIYIYIYTHTHIILWSIQIYGGLGMLWVQLLFDALSSGNRSWVIKITTLKLYCAVHVVFPATSASQRSPSLLSVCNNHQLRVHRSTAGL